MGSSDSGTIWLALFPFILGLLGFAYKVWRDLQTAKEHRAEQARAEAAAKEKLYQDQIDRLTREVDRLRRRPPSRTVKVRRIQK